MKNFAKKTYNFSPGLFPCFTPAEIDSLHQFCIDGLWHPESLLLFLWPGPRLQRCSMRRYGSAPQALDGCSCWCSRFLLAAFHNVRNGFDKEAKGLKRLCLFFDFNAVLFRTGWRSWRLSWRCSTVLCRQDLVELILETGHLFYGKGAARSLLCEAFHCSLVRTLWLASPWVSFESILNKLDWSFWFGKALFFLYRPRQVWGRFRTPVEPVVILVEVAGREIWWFFSRVLNLLSEKGLQVLNRLVPTSQPAVSLPPVWKVRRPWREMIFYLKAHLTLSTSLGRKWNSRSFWAFLKLPSSPSNSSWAFSFLRIERQVSKSTISSDLNLCTSLPDASFSRAVTWGICIVWSQELLGSPFLGWRSIG